MLGRVCIDIKPPSRPFEMRILWLVELNGRSTVVLREPLAHEAFNVRPGSYFQYQTAGYSDNLRNQTRSQPIGRYHSFCVCVCGNLTWNSMLARWPRITLRPF